MSPRPLRQFYGHDRTFAIEGIGDAVEPFRRHRDRFTRALHELSKPDWARTTRCDAWDTKAVVQHLTSADEFWALSLAGRRQPEPTTFLRGFDPAETPGAVIASRSDDSVAAALAAFEVSTATLTESLAGITDREWSMPSESPFGHVPLRVIAAHSLWDSWLHERDVLLPLGIHPSIEDDELVTATAFTLFFAGVQGGVLDDDEPVGDGPAHPLEAHLRFSDLPGRNVSLRVDRDVRVEFEDSPDLGAVDAGSAVEFVEAMTGRVPIVPVITGLPEDVAAQLVRARLIL